MAKNIFSMHINKIIVGTILVFCVGLVTLSLSMNDNDSSSIFNDRSSGKKMNNFKDIDMLAKVIPEVVKTNTAKDIKISTHRIKILGVDVFYREANPIQAAKSDLDILFLHGAAFKSLTWEELQTLSIFAALGYHVVAIDLPGYGETKRYAGSDSLNKTEFLNELITKLPLKNFIIVSPSMSGSFSIPYLKKYHDKVAGFLPVAPVGTNEIVSVARNIQTPTVIVYGEKDTSLGLASLDDLSKLPNSQSRVLKGARHPAYLDQPDEFHKILYNFLLNVKN